MYVYVLCNSVLIYLSINTFSRWPGGSLYLASTRTLKTDRVDPSTSLPLHGSATFEFRLSSSRAQESKREATCGPSKEPLWRSEKPNTTSHLAIKHQPQDKPGQARAARPSSEGRKRHESSVLHKSPGQAIKGVSSLAVFPRARNEPRSCLLYTSPSPRDRG